MKKISSKIFLIFTACSCSAVLLLGSISIVSSLRMAQQGTYENLSWMMRYYATQFSSEFQDVENSVQELELRIQNTLDVEALKSDPTYLPRYEQELAAVMGTFAEQHTSGHSAWCYFNPQLSDTPHDVYFADGNRDGIAERQDYIPFSYFDHTPTPTDDKQWWYGPVESHKPFWSNPYQWVTSGGGMIFSASYAVPIYDGDLLLAVVGSSYHFDKMSRNIKNIKVYQTGYAVLFNEKLDVIVHPSFFAGTRFTSDNLMTVESGRYKDCAEQIISGGSYGVAHYTDKQGKARLLAYSRLSNDWVLAATPPPNEIFAEVNALIGMLLLAILSCMVFSAAAAWYIGQYISRPLLVVAAGAKQIGAGDLTVQIKVDVQDEIKTVADSLNDMVRNTEQLQERLSDLAFRDPLTGGYNLNKFNILVQERLEEPVGGPYYLACVDVDGFKLINDMFGFEDGNAVLLNMYKAISLVLEPDEISARVVNDHFVVLLHRPSEEAVIELGELFRKTFMELQSAMGKTYTVGLTTGVYCIQPGEQDLPTMMDRCTMAHQAAKALNTNRRFFIYNQQLRDAAIKAKSMEDTMRQALERKEFEVYLQPKYSLCTKQMRGAEALARWVVPPYSQVVPPMEFIPLFERNGFVAELDLFMLERVCQLQRGWIDEGLPTIPISINQSKVLLFSTNYVEKVCKIVDRYQVPHNLIELEILETLIHYNSGALQRIVSQLKQLHFLVSIDDFGSGYSSLNMLKDIRADVLKIDKEFLNESEDSDRGEVVLSNVIRLARELDMSVVTEGVETEKQAELLLRLHCDTAQGFLFARPMPIESFNQLIHQEC